MTEFGPTAVHSAFKFLTDCSRLPTRWSNSGSICRICSRPVMGAGSKSRSAAVSCRTEVCYHFGRKHGRYRAVKRRETLLDGAAVRLPWQDYQARGINERPHDIRDCWLCDACAFAGPGTCFVSPLNPQQQVVLALSGRSCT